MKRTKAKIPVIVCTAFLCALAADAATTCRADKPNNAAFPGGVRAVWHKGNAGNPVTHLKIRNTFAQLFHHTGKLVA